MHRTGLLLATLGLGLVACTPDPRGPGSGGDDGGTTTPDEHFVDSPTIGALATDADTLYFVDGYALKAMPLDGGAATTLYTMPPAPSLAVFGRLESIHVGATALAFVDSTYDTDTGIETRTLRLVAKAGGAATMLATSGDSRAFLGVSFDGDSILYSSNTAVLRVPIAGGASQFVGESDQSVQYWIFSPLAQGDSIYWAADSEIYRLARGDGEGRGQPIAGVPALSAMIVAADTRFVVALAADIDFQSPMNAFAEVDPATGATTAPIALGDSVMAIAADASDVWAATFTGLVRVPRAGGALEHVTTASSLTVATSATAVFASSNTGITRVPR